MAVLTIREVPDEILTKKCTPVKEVTPKIRELIQDMIETMHEANGVGLAAPQVGILKRIFVVDVTGEDAFCCINPEIMTSEGEQTAYEGCLSVPGYSGVVTRADKVKIRAFDENMQPFEMEAEEFLARAIQHEYDHLEGIVYSEKAEGELITNEELEKLMEEAAAKEQEEEETQE